MHLQNGFHCQTGLVFTKEYTTFQVFRMIIHFLKVLKSLAIEKHLTHCFPNTFDHCTFISLSIPRNQCLFLQILLWKCWSCTVILQMRKQTFKEVNWLGQNPGRNWRLIIQQTAWWEFRLKVGNKQRSQHLSFPPLPHHKIVASSVSLSLSPWRLRFPQLLLAYVTNMQLLTNLDPFISQHVLPLRKAF